MGDFEVHLPGNHNVLNATGAIALALEMGLAVEQVSEGLKNFCGVGRRFELLKKENSRLIYDDYAHHPTEIKTVLSEFRRIFSREKITAYFEPHRFTRTQTAWEEFLHCFNEVDEVKIFPIYAASEKAISGITSKALVHDINQLHPNKAKLLGSLEELKQEIESSDSDVQVTLGAGAIGKQIRAIL